MECNKTCCVVGCDTTSERIIRYNNEFYCDRHYQQIRRNGKITRIKTKTLPANSECLYCGRENHLTRFSGDGNIYCRKHYDHMRLYGKILERTIFDKNEIIYYENHAEIILYDLKQNEKARVLLDLDDVDKIKDIKWNLGSHGYAVNTVLQTCLHNLIMPHMEEQLIDHINRNKLDNRKTNLRIVTFQQNCFNKNILSSNSSGYMGVCWDEINLKWIAQLSLNSEDKLFSRFDNKEDAIIARLKAEKEYFGVEFAPQRHLFGQYNI